MIKEKITVTLPTRYTKERLLFATKYSKVDKGNFVEDSLEKIYLVHSSILCLFW